MNAFVPILEGPLPLVSSLNEFPDPASTANLSRIPHEISGKSARTPIVVVAIRGELHWDHAHKIRRERER